MRRQVVPEDPRFGLTCSASRFLDACLAIQDLDRAMNVTCAQPIMFRRYNCTVVCVNPSLLEWKASLFNIGLAEQFN
jgi:hypothetical protein